LKTFAFGLIAAILAGSAIATPPTCPAGDILLSNGSCVSQAPEIDPSSAASGLVLLFGGLAILRGRRR